MNRKKPVVIAVASGKGGTGKTFIAVNLAAVSSAVLYDCDVEEPNSHLFFGARQVHCRNALRLVPRIDHGRCTTCGICASFCQFNALALLGGEVQVFTQLCHSCGGCVMVCPEHAVDEVPLSMGVIRKYETGGPIIIQGILDIGTAAVPPLIHEVMKEKQQGSLHIIDAPPGTVCPAMTAVTHADHVLLVAEPTPFGLHDVKLMAEALKQRGIPFSAAANKVETPSDEITEFCEQNKIPLIARIPMDTRILDCCARGIPAAEIYPEYRKLFENLHLDLLQGTTI